jgi:tetratricopeptide (TPR) repeat protein
MSADMASPRGYWPAMALRSLEGKKYSSAVEMCKRYLAEEPHCLSGRLIYARALYYAGQQVSAADQFYQVLAIDPENIVALKYIGDIKFSSGDETAAFASYRRIMELDPYCRGVASELTLSRQEPGRTITISRLEEKTVPIPPSSLRNIPFYTETMADLYLAQGYPKLASVVYKTLLDTNRHPRLLDKLAQAEEKMKEKDRRTVEHVHDTD